MAMRSSGTTVATGNTTSRPGIRKRDWPWSTASADPTQSSITSPVTTAIPALVRIQRRAEDGVGGGARVKSDCKRERRDGLTMGVWRDEEDAWSGAW